MMLINSNKYTLIIEELQNIKISGIIKKNIIINNIYL